jgi:hypothetical protein
MKSFRIKTFSYFAAAYNLLHPGRNETIVIIG